MFEDLNIENLDFLSNEEDLHSESGIDSNFEKYKDEFYKYSKRDPNDIYSELKNLSEDELSQKLDIESILKYNNELRKQNSFNNEFSTDENDENQNKLQNSFRDYLILKNISGRRKGLFYQNIIPLERVNDSGKIVEVFDDNKTKEHLEHDKSTVIVHKTNNDEIDLIEVLCSCGKRTFIKLDYNSTDNAVIYSNGEHYPTFEDDIEDYSEESSITVQKHFNEFDENLNENTDFEISNSNNITNDFNFEDFNIEK